MEKSRYLKRVDDKRGIHMKGRKLTEEHKRNIGLGGSKAVYQFDKDMNFIREYNSISETGIVNVSQVCLGKRKTAAGFKWKYKNDWDLNLNKDEK